MIIAQISDTHLALDTPDANQRIRDFALTVVDLNALDPAPDVIVHTGDIVIMDDKTNTLRPWLRSRKRVRRYMSWAAIGITGRIYARPFPHADIFRPIPTSSNTRLTITR